MKLMIFLISILGTLGLHNAAFASGCMSPEYKEIEVRSGVTMMSSGTGSNAPVTEVWHWKNGVQVVIGNLLVDSEPRLFQSPLFQTKWISPEEIESVLQRLPEEMEVQFETHVFEVVSDMSDCIDVGTRYQQTAYSFKVSFGMNEKMLFTAQTDFAQVPVQTLSSESSQAR